MAAAEVGIRMLFGKSVFQSVVDRLDKEAEDYAFNVISLIESILENPDIVLRKQAREQLLVVEAREFERSGDVDVYLASDFDLDGFRHRPQFRVLLAQAHDLGPVRGRAHPRLHLVETVEHLVESGLGQSQG